MTCHRSLTKKGSKVALWVPKKVALSTLVTTFRNNNLNLRTLLFRKLSRVVKYSSHKVEHCLADNPRKCAKGPESFFSVETRIVARSRVIAVPRLRKDVLTNRSVGAWAK